MINPSLEENRKTQLRAVISFVIIVGIILLTALGLLILKLNKRTAKEEPKERALQVVQLLEVSESEHLVKIYTQGVVESSRETQLAAEVNGRVLEVSPKLLRGGFIKKNERLVQIDPADYRSALSAAEVKRTEAELDLEIERAQVEQARLDWAKIGAGIPQNPLVLREPYLAAAEARALASREDAAKARRDLERTEILAPFDAAIRSKNVEVGSVVNTGKVVADLYSSNDLEIRLPLTLEDLGFLPKLTSLEQEVILSGKIGNSIYTWKGQMKNIDPEISRESLSAHILVKVSPTENSEFPLPPVGLFVDAHLSGKTLKNVKEIPRLALLDKNQVILVDEKDRIQFRRVEVMRLTRDTAVISSGLEKGERVAITRISAPIVGMQVKVETQAEGSPE